IATDFNPYASPSLNMQTAIALSCLRLGMSLGEAISAATINGAHAVGRADRIGSLEPGKVADLIVLNVSDYRDLRHTLGTNVVHLTMKSGEVIYEEAEVAPAPSRARLHAEPRPSWRPRGRHPVKLGVPSVTRASGLRSRASLGGRMPRTSQRAK